MQSCTYRGCDDPATATVLVGATRQPVCFTHEREYADRYGPADIHPLAQPVRPRWIGRAAADLTGYVLGGSY